MPLTPQNPTDTSDTSRRYSRLWWIIIAIAILTTSAVYCFVMADRPMFHDDLGYYTGGARWVATHYPEWLRFPTRMVGNWLSVNGRMGEMTTVIFYNLLPRWLFVALIGVMMAGFYTSVIAWSASFVQSRGGRLLTGAATLTFLYFGMTWWDNFMLFIMQSNYVWSVPLTLGSLWLILRVPMHRKRALWLMPLIFAAAQWHEAAGVPFSCGLFLYLLMHWRDGSMTRINKWLAIAFLAGAAASVFSPALFRRAAEASVPDEALWYMLLVSVWLAGIFTLLVLVALCVRPKMVISLCRTSWIIFGVAAVAGICVCAYSGSYGRTGWFAQISAWIALCGLISAWSHQSSSACISSPTSCRGLYVAGAVFTIVASIAVVASSILFADFQHRLNREVREIITEYRQSPDGVVFHDLTTPSQHPAALIGRAWGLQGLYDQWSRYLLERTYSGYGLKPLTVLPASLRDMQPDTTFRQRSIDGVTLMYPAPQKEPVKNDYQSDKTNRIYVFKGENGRLYMRQRFLYKGIYGVADMPADLAPGERYPNVNLPFKADPTSTENSIVLPDKIL